VLGLNLLIAVLFCGGKYAGEFQNLGVGARICAMGEAGIAQCQDPSGIALNPSGSVELPRSLILMHAENFTGIVKNEFGSVVFPRETGAFGFGLQAVLVNDIKLTTLPDTTLPPGPDNPPVTKDTVATKDIIFYLNASKKNGLFSYGTNLKVYYRNLYLISGFGGGIDAGLRVSLSNLDIGAVVRDIVLAPIIWDNKTRENISPRLGFGIAPKIPITRLNSEWVMEADLLKNLEQNDFNLKIGFEYNYKNIISGRLGKTEQRYTMGMGLKYKRIIFDYALLTHSELGVSHKFSCGLKF